MDSRSLTKISPEHAVLETVLDELGHVGFAVREVFCGFTIRINVASKSLLLLDQKRAYLLNGALPTRGN